MKKILLIVLFSFGITTAQEYQLADRTLTGIFNVDGKSKSEIYSSISKWISLNYNSSKAVVQLSDLEAGNIVVKGMNKLTHKNAMKILYSKSELVKDYTTTEFNHTIEINVKDNKFRIIYTIININGSNDNYFECIKLNSDNENSVDKFNNELEINLKTTTFLGKEKRELCKSEFKLMFEDMRNGLENSMKNTMLSIEQSVKSNGW